MIARRYPSRAVLSPAQKVAQDRERASEKVQAREARKQAASLEGGPNERNEHDG